MNRLAQERSPYLLQHKDNPVDWFPWGEEAFARARAEDKPIFLSIGYSTCHWCHVMAHESFEHADVAGVLNEHFVSIKVDREERPDVDRVYMTFVQATTGSGGWPMSVWLTPELKPFYGGTYFPPTSRWGRPGFLDILREVARVWHADRAKVVQSSETLTRQLQSIDRSLPAAAGIPGAAALAHTVQQFRQAFDARRGGFGDAPKFPRPSELLFLLREHARTGDADSREMALRTLRAMALGGLRDHVGGGFHRYAVDGEWRVPHFEKMLYDQAQLVLAFAEAGQTSGDRFYTEVAEDTLLYVQREMTHADGGFYSAEDADSEGREGAFYVWTAAEIDALLGDAAPIVKQRFGVEPGGNAPHDPQGEFVGRNIFYVAASVDDLARDAGRTPAAIVDLLHESRLKLFQARLARPRPHLDDKILTAWNGLMIAAFARMARVTGSAEFLASARRAAAFVREHLWRADGRTLLRRYRDGHADIDAYAEDYAGLIFGLLELFQADADPMWLEWAIALQRRQDELFWDESGGAWFSTTGRDASVLMRMKEDYDGAEPTASSMSVLNLLVLSHLVEDAAWTERIDITLRYFGTRLEQIGRGVPMMAAALSAYTATLQQIVLVEGDGADALAGALASEYLPFAIVLRVVPARQRALAASLPFIAGMTPVGGAAAAYVCHHFTCRQPVTTVEALHEQLRATA
ncbi:MAG TPA: thioredoxin domain-containing protein [Vicinamibacterales bacterium]|nr:thioredoxin domain-containing protein [Vicinamibacterales bacterium]